MLKQFRWARLPLIAGVLVVSPALLCAEQWSGVLEDGKCFAFEENNAGRGQLVDRDQNLEIHYCAANAKTKTFTVVLKDGRSFNLDADGNAKAAELVRQNAAKHLLVVTVNGQMNQNIIEVNSISPAER